MNPSTVFLSLLLALAWTPPRDKSPPPSSPCHVFIDNGHIWTLETVQSPGGARVPILNIITLIPGEWDFRPGQIHIHNKQGKQAQLQKFSMDTGVAGEPYTMRYLKVLGNSFIGLDLIGECDDFAEPARVIIDLGDHRFKLQAMDCSEFEALAEKINQVNFDSPDIREDFEVLKIEFLGTKGPRPKEN